MESVSLIKYEAARRALTEARNVDEVKDIRNKALAMELYAKQAKDTELIEHATEIRLRAERRLGEMMAEQPKAKPPGGSDARPRKDRVSEKPDHPATLAEVGIDKNLANRARKAAKMTEEQFEEKVRAAKSEGITKIAARTAKSVKASALASAVLDEGKSQRQVQREFGATHHAVHSSVQQERARRERKEDPEIDPKILSLSAQEKLEVALRQHKRQLDADYEKRVQAGIKSAIENTVLPHYHRKMEEYDLVVKARKGIMNRSTYRLILSCLHPDQSASPERIRKAFEALQGVELALCDEKEMPTSGASAIPTTYDELMKRRAAVKERRQQQRSGGLRRN